MPQPVGPRSDNQEVSPRIVLDLITGKWRAQAVCVAAELGLADILKDGPRSTAEIAEIAKLSEDAVYRLLRALASLGLFRSLPGRRFTLTPLGAYLQSDVPGSLRGFARFAGHDVTWRPWGQLAYSVRTGTPAFVHIFGVRSFDYYAEHPDVAAIVNDAMTAVTTKETTAIIAAYDFPKIGTVVDVGGGHGLLLASILKIGCPQILGSRDAGPELRPRAHGGRVRGALQQGRFSADSCRADDESSVHNRGSPRLSPCEPDTRLANIRFELSARRRSSSERWAANPEAAG